MTTHKREGSPGLGLAAGIAILAVFLADFVTPLGFAHGMLYIPCLLLAFYCGQRLCLIVLGWLTALLTVGGLLLAPPAFVGMELPWVLGNRLLAVMVILATTWLLLQWHDHKGRLQRALERREAAHHQLQDQQRLLDITARVMRLGGWKISLPDYHLSYTDTALRLHGLPEGQRLTLEQAIALYHPDVQQTMHRDLAACAEEGLAIDRELPLADGETWLRVSAEAVYGADGKVAEIQGAVQDITPRKRGEALLQDSRDRFEHLANVLPLAVWTAEPDGTVDYANRYLSEYSGVPAADILQPGGWLSLLHPEDRQRCVDTWMRSVASGKAYQIEFRLRRWDGRYRRHRVQAAPVFNAGGQVIKWYGTAVEIDPHGD